MTLADDFADRLTGRTAQGIDEVPNRLNDGGEARTSIDAANWLALQQRVPENCHGLAVLFTVAEAPQVMLNQPHNPGASLGP